MDLKFTKIVNEDDGKKVVSMYIFGIIGYDVIGEEFAREIKYLYEQLKIDNLDIYINSPGGSVISGYSIISSIRLAEKSGVEITMYNVGVAYSMGGIILVSGKNRIAWDYSTLMIHDPSFDNKDDEDLSDSDRKFLQEIGNSLADIISGNTGIEIDEVKNMMRVETVFSAKEAKSRNFVDSIEKTGRKVDLGNCKTNLDKMVAFSNIFYNQNNFINEKILKMERIAKFLNLSPAASEDMILDELKRKFDELEKAKTLRDENKTLTEKVKTLEDKIVKNEESAKKEKAIALVNKAKEDGLIPDEESVVNDWVENAVENYEKTERILQKMKPVTTSINNKFEKSDKKMKGKKDELVNKYEELIDNPEEMDRFATQNPEEFEKMENAWNAANEKRFSVEFEK
jgi:ATP-dependent protease ClpP protease subunit